MKKIIRRGCALVMSIAVLVSTLYVLPRAAASGYARTIELEIYKNYEYAFEALRLINEERRAHGLSPLKMDYDLLSAAAQRGAEVQVYFSHTRPDGGSPSDLGSGVNGENIAIGQSSPGKAVEGWMSSYGHRQNILKSEYVSTGVAAIKHNGVYSWVQLFGRGGASGASERSNTDATASVRISDGTVRPTLSIGVTASGYAVDGSEMSVGTQYKCSLLMRNPGYTAHSVRLSGVSWSSSDTSRLTVSSSGTATAKGRGTATITAYSAALGMGAELSVSLTGTVPVRGIDVYKKASSSRWETFSQALEMDSGERIELRVTVTPENASDRTYSVKSSDTSVARYDSGSGCVVAVSRGTCTLTAVSSGDSDIKRSFVVKVDGGAPKVAVTSIKVANKSIVFGERLTLRAEVSPSDASDKSVRWSSDSENISVGRTTGKITYALAGSARITAVSVSDGSVRGSCIVRVRYRWWQALERALLLKKL